MSEFMPEVHRNAVWMKISREMALDYGLVNPTPEEAAERAESRRIWKLREIAAWEVFDRMVPRLDALTDPTIRAVLDLHVCEDEYTYCGECYYGDDHQPWPCATVKVIAETNDIPVPEIELWKRPT